MITETANIDGEIREAAFSDDYKYRYRLDITWDSKLPTLVMIGLNPSTATHLKDDPTIRRCKEFARTFGCGTYRMLNAFAFRSTDYKALFRNQDPIGPENTLEFLRLWTDGSLTIACWGAHITERTWRHYYRGKDIAEAIPALWALKLTQSGHPQHPLYLPADLRPFPFKYDSCRRTAHVNREGDDVLLCLQTPGTASNDVRCTQGLERAQEKTGHDIGWFGARAKDRTAK